MEKRKIYFSAAVADCDDRGIYKILINHLKNYGKVLTEFIGDIDRIKKDEKEFNDEQIYERDIRWLEEFDVVIAELSARSHGVGYELALVECFSKPNLCLFRNNNERRLSSMIAGNKRFNVKRFYEKFKIT